ncbi:hypothetical protein G7Z17_g6012 [Cylindrodendrum hubeiense]|uniref:Ras-GAP domain-containing protein n=1 Tax=Cylindrodendrum hubeiense TaxID=595255 RepID=A0A9P5H5J6_9HYPO|nr:hypothetical protein G7Z17_g6012 [Cylindrodendrum hubeiense]
MNGDAGLVGCLVDRLATRLPHRAGTSGQSLQQDDILHVTRATLVELGNTAISSVLDSLLSLLEDLARPYTAVASHPTHVLHSELYILAIIADCCSAHWASLSHDSDTDSAPTPPPLDEVLVSRLFDALKHLLEPIPDSYILPAQTLLDQVSTRNVAIPRSDDSSATTGDDDCVEDDPLGAHLAEMDAYVKTVIEYVTASSWAVAFDYFRNVVYNIRTTTVAQSGPTASGSFQDAEKAALVVLRLLSFFWVDGPKLGQVIQEICSSFLHFRKPYQNTIAVVTPLLITRWLDRFPREFVQLHLLHKRLDGGADTLFDMTQAATDNGRRKALLYPLQTTLLFLLPDVFEVASNMREAKSSSMVKKVSFLDGLRKALRNRNEQAGHCLVSLLRAARHFDAESDSALVSYALDVQDEVRDSVFRRVSSSEPTLFEQDMMTAAFVSLAHLNLDGVNALVETCISPSAPNSFKLAVVQGCSYFAQQPYALRYHELFDTAVPFMRSQLEIENSKSTGIPTQGGVDGIEMVCSILQFLDASPARLLDDLSGDNPSTGFFKSFLLCVLSAEPSVRRLATGVADRLLTGHLEAYRKFDFSHQFGTQELRGELWSRSSKVLLGLCERIALQKDDQGLVALQEYLKARLLLLKHMPELAEIPEETPDVVSASSKLETTLLISLCSANIDTCQLVTSCIGLFFQECSIVDKHAESAKSSASVLRNVDEKLVSEWRNYSGFLASLGGICTADQAIILEEPALGGLRWIDRISSEHYEEPLLTRYLRLSIQLLACANVRVREAMRDVLSSEVSPALYHPLFKALESELEVLFTGALAPVDKGQESEVVFAEQAASLLKALVERLESPSDLGAASSVHLGALTLNFAKFLDGVSDTPNTLRVKIRDDMSRVQKDLDKACLKSLADLTFRLPLQPSDSHTDAGMSEMKSQMFHTYFNRFLSLLNHEPSDSSRSDPSLGVTIRDETISNSDLAITILSNLLSANIDVGLKHSLNIGYHDNVEIRTAFVKVLYNILIQGTEFSNLTDSAVSEKYEELLELLTSDLSLAMSMSVACPSTDVDELTICLLTVFEQRGLIFELLEALVKQEIEDTENEAELLRRSCVATKTLSVYAKWKGSSYLRATLQKVLERLMLTSKDLDLELDPARVSTAEELQKNALQLRIVAKVFIDDICASSSSMPPAFRKICNIISNAVVARFPDAKYTAVGAFIFLRFFCPAIVAPEVEGLVSTAPSKEMRRGLLLIAKVIQNLANNVLFGAKEPYMFPLNDFLTQNIYHVTTFLREISDGLSIICIILRHIETESIDYDTLIYCYLKIASRLWHRPFGLLIDATCYNGRNEPQDDLFKKLELLTPSELSCNLTRIYVYNMNSAFKRCFRRLLRGKIEVIIKVGSQFVQVTTTKKQEIFAGFRLGTTVNDIFRLGEVDEAPTSIQTEDDSAFGLRADNGKIVMYFTSPKKSDVLQTIRGAKAKHGKDSRTQKSIERLIRPQDVPGTLLNLALANLSSPDHVLRLSSYNLLGALCKAFKFSSASRLVCTKDVSVPLDPMRFIVNMSKELAQAEPQLTSDFLTEFFVGWESFPDEQKPLSLAYMAPWLPGLRTNILANELDGEKGREKVAALFRKLIDITVQDHALIYSLEQSVWPKIVQDEILLEIFLDELLKTAMNYGAHEEPLEVISSIVVGIGTVTLRGKILSRLRKALNRSSLRPTKYLPDNAVWTEICILLQFCLSLSFDNGVQSQLFLPEIFHVVTMLANTGSQDVRLLVYRLLVNSVHAICTSFDLDDAKSSKLRASLDFLCDPRSDIFSAPPAFVRDGASVSTSQEAGPALSATENLASALFEICSVAAPTVDLSNAWRSRWMSLVASTAFQNNPAIQPRAFTVMGCLAREEVDDDLLYQVLVALRNSVGRFGEDHNSEMLVSIVTSLSKMMAKLPSASRYGLQLFWLAMSLVRLVPANLFNCAALFLEAVLANISTGEDFRGTKMVPLLLQGRIPLDEAALPLEDVYGIHFTHDTFEFAVCACLARGLTDTVTRQTAMRVLSSFLEMTTSSSDPTTSIRDVPEGSAYLALLHARAVGPDELRDSLWSAGINPGEVNTVLRSRELPEIGAIQDKNLLLMTAIELVDFQYLEDTVQTRSLQWLNELATQRPSVAVHLCAAIRSLLDDILLHGQNSTTLGAAHILLRTLSSNPQLSRAVGSMTSLTETLDDMGFGGLWRSCSLGSMDDINRDCLELTEKLIELIII